MLFNRALSSSEINAIYATDSVGLVRAPEFTGTQPVGNNQFQLSLRGKTGKNFTIYASLNLACLDKSWLDAKSKWQHSVH